MCRYVQETWNSLNLPHADTLRLMPWHCAPGVPFTKDQLSHALSQLPANKAVAYCFAPTILLKEQANVIADLVFPNLCHWWQQFPPAMPQHWRDGSASKAVLQQYTCWHHGKQHLNRPCADGYTQMPIGQYLGVTISYTSTAALTMQQWLKQAVKLDAAAGSEAHPKSTCKISTLEEDCCSHTDIWTEC